MGTSRPRWKPGEKGEEGPGEEEKTDEGVYGLGGPDVLLLLVMGELMDKGTI